MLETVAVKLFWSSYIKPIFKLMRVIPKRLGDDFVKIIALHTYSRSDSRSYEIELQDNWISMHGFRFQEFVVKRKV